MMNFEQNLLNRKLQTEKFDICTNHVVVTLDIDGVHPWHKSTPRHILQLGGKVSEKTSFGVGMELKKVHKQDRVRKPQEPYHTSERCRPPLWPPTQCTCIPSSLCCSHTTK